MGRGADVGRDARRVDADDVVPTPGDEVVRHRGAHDAAETDDHHPRVLWERCHGLNLTRWDRPVARPWAPAAASSADPATADVAEPSTVAADLVAIGLASGYGPGETGAAMRALQAEVFEASRVTDVSGGTALLTASGIGCRGDAG